MAKRDLLKKFAFETGDRSKALGCPHTCMRGRRRLNRIRESGQAFAAASDRIESDSGGIERAFSSTGRPF